MQKAGNANALSACSTALSHHKPRFAKLAAPPRDSDAIAAHARSKEGE
jgi:hypothetical protein